MQRVVSFHYVLTDPKGEVLDSSEGQAPLSYLEGSDQIIPGLENALRSMKKGDKQKIDVPAAEAYGLRSEDAIMEVERKQFPKGELKVGDRFQVQSDMGPMPVVVTACTEKTVTLDANHPLAGIDLTFKVEITDARAATKEELQHGHAHGPEGHHHH